MLLNKLKGFIFLFFVVFFLYIRAKPLPDIKILALSKLKGFAADKLIATQNIRFIFHLLENIVGKGENAGYQHFLLPPPPPAMFYSLPNTKLNFPIVFTISTEKSFNLDRSEILLYGRQ